MASEFGLNSSCLSQLNDFEIVSLQKIQNLPQNAIRSIAGTLMCQLGYLSLLVHKKCSKPAINRAQNRTI